MKRILFLMIAISMSLSGYAQNEFSSKFKPIPPKNNAPKIKKVTPPKADLPKIASPKVIKKLEPSLPNNVSKIDFVNPKGINKKEVSPERVTYRRNQNLGNFKTTSITSRIRYRDAAYVDGDKIRVYLNDKVIDYEVVMDGEFKGFEIKLEKGINKIDFEALNEGFAPPNTAEFQVYDDKGSLISDSQWNLGMGFKATIILMKE
ncbi:hypothetical protein E0I26_13130 [Flavobacterium rhamnosiphilum]|uniref:Secreted protein n=1 Tax=Flavobacterium rhamnosiphilum TaxID=2541724 RepID=A0A4R5F594_9FLAO|nr:hypothetical protein [Flavobacterium rhamnosiphilum]TDE42802.1 hypothetical protein E0I26_13130 [Flavobacterium rhamnosiphilum]